MWPLKSLMGQLCVVLAAVDLLDELIRLSSVEVPPLGLDKGGKLFACWCFLWVVWPVVFYSEFVAHLAKDVLQ